MKSQRQLKSESPNNYETIELWDIDVILKSVEKLI